MIFNIFFLIIFSLQNVNCNLFFSNISFDNNNSSNKINLVNNINIYSKELHVNDELINTLNLQPTSVPTSVPTLKPTLKPTLEPILDQTSLPTSIPTSIPTTVPILEPTTVPTLNSKSKAYINTNNSINISKTELRLILIFGIVGIIIIIYIFCKIYPKINKYAIKNTKNDNDNDNNIVTCLYNQNENDNKNDNKNENDNYKINNNTKEENYDLLNIIEIRMPECNI